MLKINAAGMAYKDDVIPLDCGAATRAGEDVPARCGLFSGMPEIATFLLPS